MLIGEMNDGAETEHGGYGAEPYDAAAKEAQKHEGTVADDAPDIIGHAGDAFTEDHGQRIVGRHAGVRALIEGNADACDNKADEENYDLHNESRGNKPKRFVQMITEITNIPQKASIDDGADADETAAEEHFDDEKQNIHADLKEGIIDVKG